MKKPSLVPLLVIIAVVACSTHGEPTSTDAMPDAPVAAAVPMVAVGVPA